MTDEQKRKIEEFKDKYLGIRPFGGIPEMNHQFEERGLDTGIAFGIKLENERLSAEIESKIDEIRRWTKPWNFSDEDQIRIEILIELRESISSSP